MSPVGYNEIMGHRVGGLMVRTSVCGSDSVGSIPTLHPIFNKENK